MRTETVSLDNYKDIREIWKQLDPLNIRILTVMADVGPRNLLEVSRQCKLPFTTVYHRVERLEKPLTLMNQLTYLIPCVSKLGLVRATVLAQSKAGAEKQVTRALKLPNMWRVVERCEGAFTHHSIQLIPLEHLDAFRAYLTKLEDLQLIASHRFFLGGDLIPIFPDFSCYNSSTREWSFKWNEWLQQAEKGPIEKIQDMPPSTHPIRYDHTDLEIIAHLEVNARFSFVEIARSIGVSPRTVKHRYDTRLVPSGVVRYFAINAQPYPMEMMARHRVMLRFSDEREMGRFHLLSKKHLFFVWNLEKVVGENVLLLGTRTPHQQIPQVLEFFSCLSEAGHLVDYSIVRTSPYARGSQTISPEIFDDSTGEWIFNPDKCLAQLRLPAPTDPAQKYLQDPRLKRGDQPRPSGTYTRETDAFRRIASRERRGKEH